MDVSEVTGNETGDMPARLVPAESVSDAWGYLPNEPCRFCCQIECVYFLNPSSGGPEDRSDQQPMRCSKCKRDWQA